MSKDASIEIIQKCLNNCIHCSSRSTDKSVAILPLSVIVEVIAGLKKIGIERVCLSGGEPLLHPDIVEIVKQIVGHQMTADIYSCGIVGSCEKPEPVSIELLTELKAAGLRALLFNIPSPQEQTYDIITQRKGHFSIMCQSVENANKCRLRTEAHFVPMKQNVADAVSVVQFAEELGVEQVNYLKLVPHGRARDNVNKIMLTDEELKKLQSELVAMREKGKSIRIGLPLSSTEEILPCHAVREKLYIKYDGTVFGCEAFKYITFQNEFGKDIVPDNISDNSIVEIYQKSEYLQHSVQLVQHYEPCNFGCGNCPVQKYLKEQEIMR